VKAYAITALTKIYAFEIAAGRKVDMLSEVFAEKNLG
jgi:AP-4 complex subunit epsilon-1